MALVLKICGGTWENESRDKRELSTYCGLGAEVAVLAKGEIGDKGREDTVDGFKVYRYSTRPLGKRFPNAINRVISLFKWAGFVRKMKPDVITGHDLLPGLTIAWMSNFFRRKKSKLIYDAHEFELGRNKKRSKFALFCIKYWERFLIKKCAFSIMVNDSIADEVQRIHKLKNRPIVVRSTPECWNIDIDVCNEVRERFYSEFKNRGIENKPFLLMYHGVVATRRGVETLLWVTAKNPKICSIILGNVDKTYLKTLHNLTYELSILDRVIFYNAVPISELWKYVGAVDVGMILINGTMKNHIYSLPNKFFENIQSMTPIISTNFPEMKRIIDKYEIGLTCNSSDVNAVNECVEKMRTDSELYSKYKENLKTAKSELCWENEKKILEKAFSEILED